MTDDLDQDAEFLDFVTDKNDEAEEYDPESNVFAHGPSR